MSLWIDQEAIRSAAQRQRKDAQRFAQDQAFLDSTKTLPPGFRARVLRSDLAANRRQDRLQWIAGLLAVGLVGAATLLSSAWHARQRAAPRRAQAENPPSPGPAEPPHPEPLPVSSGLPR